MREFRDEQGAEWVAGVAEREGLDYKGRFCLVLKEGQSGVEVCFEDVRWNSEETAARTLSTMSVVELRRRLRSARGRGVST